MEKNPKKVNIRASLIFSPGSFKIRGIGRTCAEAVAQGAARLVGSSGGNAGLAMAHAATGLGVPLTLFIPQSTPSLILDKLKVCNTNTYYARSIMLRMKSLVDIRLYQIPKHFIPK